MSGVWVGWAMLLVWGSGLSGAQALLAQGGWLGPFLPDLGLTLLVGLGLQVRRSMIPNVALTLALARCAYTVDPPVAVLSAFLAAGLFVRAIGRGVDLSGPFGRTLLTFPVVFGYGAWLALARLARARVAVDEVPAARQLVELCLSGLPAALMSALVALLIGGWFARLPGLSVLQKRSAFG